jgi:hypothetical protein
MGVVSKPSIGFKIKAERGVQPQAYTALNAVVKKAIGSTNGFYCFSTQWQEPYQALYRLRINDALVPPNPKELLMAYSTSA